MSPVKITTPAASSTASAPPTASSGRHATGGNPVAGRAGAIVIPAMMLSRPS